MKTTRTFVILRHRTPAGEHWDVMLETESALATWAVPPQNRGGQAFVCPAKKLPDHRKLYLHYEGEIAGNRGTVARIDSGSYETDTSEEPTPPCFRLNGKLFSGMLRIEEKNIEEGNDNNDFQMIFCPLT